MDALKDIWASLVSGLRDRTTNPLTVSFALSWVFWNYKFFIVLYGDGTGAEKLAAIEMLYPSTEAAWRERGFLYPLATSLFYVFVYPPIGMVAIWAYRKYQVITSNMVKIVEKTRTLSHEEAANLTRRHERDRKKWEDELASQRSQIAELRRVLNAKDESEGQTSSENEEVSQQPSISSGKTLTTTSGAAEKERSLLEPLPTDEITIDVSGKAMQLTKNERELLLRLSEWANARKAIDIAEGLAKNFSIVEQELRQLLLKNLVIEKSMYTGTGWVLTPLGRDVAVLLLKQA
jgi:hypothetical protein